MIVWALSKAQREALAIVRAEAEFLETPFYVADEHAIRRFASSIVKALDAFGVKAGA